MQIKINSRIVFFFMSTAWLIVSGNPVICSIKIIEKKNYIKGVLKFYT